MSTSTGHSSQGSSSLETATETGHDIHVHARCNMLVTWSDSGMHLVSIQSMCRNLVAQEWTYPQPGSSHTFCCFCCCFCGGNRAQHHGKSCWCHLTSCLPPLCYILSDPSIHLPLTSSPSLCPSSLRSQHTIPPKLLSLRRWYSQKFQANNSYKTCSWVCIIFKEANRNIQSCFYTSAQEI